MGSLLFLVALVAVIAAAAGFPAVAADLATGVVTVFCDGVQAYAAMLIIAATLRLFSRLLPSSAGWRSDRGRSSGLSMMALIGRNHTVRHGLSCQLPGPWYHEHAFSAGNGATSSPRQEQRPARPVQHGKLEALQSLEEVQVPTIGRHTTAVARRSGRAAPRSRFRSAGLSVLGMAWHPAKDETQSAKDKLRISSSEEAQSLLTAVRSLC